MNKKVFIALSMLFFSGLVMSQPGAGYILVGGDIHFNVSSDKTKSGNITTLGPKTSNFGIMPYAGIFLSENFAAGLGIGYSNSMVRQEDVYVPDDRNRSTNPLFVIGPFARYYTQPAAANACLFAQAGVDFGFGKNINEYTIGSTTTTTESNISSLGIGITPGIAIYATDQVAFEVSIGWFGYSQNVSKWGSGSSETKNIDSRFGFNFNESFSFGVSVLL